MKHIHDFPRDIVEHEDMGIVMPDGCRLSARVWLPKDAEADPVPAILEHLPYRKRDGTAARDALTHPWFAGHGYACIRVDMRGNGDSEGLMEDEYTPQELQDACDVIAWAAAQPWCNGRVGMMGISWGGFNGLQVAMMRPPALKAVVTLCSTTDRFADDIHYKGGCLLNSNLGWATTMLSYSSRPPDPRLAGGDWRRLWLERLQAQPFLASTWLREQARTAYWEHGSPCEDYAAIEAAVLSIGGWHDGYRNTISHLVSNLSSPVKGIVGPWNHKYPHIAAPEPKIGFLQEAKRWWDRWLKGIETGVEKDPDYRAWLMDSVAPARKLENRPGRWIAEDRWPSPEIMERTFHFGDGTLREEAADLTIPVSTPVGGGLCCGSFFPFNYGEEMPDVQNPDDAEAACFDGPPLAESLDIVGAPAVEFTAAADRPRALAAVRLCDVAPDGTSALITYGLLNLTHRNAAAAPEPLVPGRDFTARVVLDQIAYRIPAGHRLRVAVSTDYWPLIWPSPEAVSLTLTSGALSLPVRPRAEGDEWTFEEPEGAAPWNIETLRPSSTTHAQETDGESGETVTVIRHDFGEQRDRDLDLLSGSRAEERWSVRPGDPLSAKAHIHWRQDGGREGWLWRSEAETAMRCDAGNFYLDAHLRVFENDELIFERRYEDVIRRDWV